MSAPVQLELPPWRQSNVALYHKCGRAYWLKYVQLAQRDQRTATFAAPIGTAAHSGAELILRELQLLRLTSPEQLRDAFGEGLELALQRCVDEGDDLEPDALERSLPKQATTLERLERLAEEPRIRAIDWDLIEARFEFELGGRTFQGTLDASGTAARDYHDWGRDGRDPVHLKAGDRVLLDWKNGDVLELSRAARRVNIQQGFYALALEQLGKDISRLHCVVAPLRDLDRTTRPKDAAGESIPKMVRTLNPEFVAALGVDEEEAEGSRKAAKDKAGKRIPKRLEAVNPEWLAASSTPRGPLLRVCRVNHTVTRAAIGDAIRGAEAGLFPATGGLTGACEWCEFKGACAATDGRPA